MVEAQESVRQIVRVKGTDLNGLLTIENSLRKVRGVGHVFARIIRVKAGFPVSKKLGELSDEELKKIEDVLDNPEKHNIPGFLLNRRKDVGTGKDVHLASVDLEIGVKSDIALMRSMRSYKGVRHAVGLKVRGQRTKSTGRKGSVVGVTRKKVQPAQKKQ